MKTQILSWHHGTCRVCKERLKLVLMFGYNEQTIACYSICKDCIFKNLQYILYGCEAFKDSKLKDKSWSGFSKLMGEDKDCQDAK